MKQKQWTMVSTICIVLLLAALGITSLAFPKESMLTIENRKAATFPSFSWDDWISGEY